MIPPDPAFLRSFPEDVVLGPRFALLRERLVGKRIEAVYLLAGSRVGLLLEGDAMISLEPGEGRRVAEDPRWTDGVYCR